MARYFSTVALATLLTAGGMAAPAAEQADTAAMGAQESARRRAAARDALQQVQEARLAYSAKRYTQAVEHYRNALSVLPPGAEADKLRTFINESLADALIARAIDYRSVGRLQEAKQFLREAMQLDPKNRRAQLELVNTEDPERTNPALNPQHVGDVEEVSRLLTLGYSYLDLGKYDEALQTFHAVAQYDGYNTAAQRGIEKVNMLRRQYYTAAHDARRAEMLAEAEAGWDIGSVSYGDPAALQTSPVGEAPAADVTEQTREQQFVTMLDEIRVPRFELEKNGIREVIEILSGIVRQNENNFAQMPNRFNFSTDFGSRDSEAFRALDNKQATLVLQDVTLRQVVNEVASYFGLDYYVIPSGVEFVLPGQGERLEVRRFTAVDPHSFSEDSADDDDDDDTGSGSRGLRVKRLDPQAFFKARGITFPQGASVSYNPNTRVLVMRNTRRNLDEAANWLDSSTQQNDYNVVLNITMVEVSEHDLEDLGFEWLLQMGTQFGSSDMNLAGGVPAAVAGATALPLITTRRPVGSYEPPTSTSGLRSIGEASTRQDMDSLIEMGSASAFNELNGQRMQSPAIFGLRGVWSAADVSVIMRGLSQKKGADTLYNPRIVLDPSTDEMVSFVNVKEMFYPTEFDQPQAQTSVIYERDNNNNWNNRNNGYGYQTYSAQAYSTVRSAARTAISALSGIASVLSSGPEALGDIAFDLVESAAAAGALVGNNAGNWGGGNGNVVGMTAVAINSFPREFVRYGVEDEQLNGVGAIVQVHKAEPIDNGSKVKLALSTTINDFEGFLDWGSPIYVTMKYGMKDDDIKRIALSPNHIFQPIFKRYTTSTNLTVADGAVLVMGGLHESRIVRYEDKVPVLGDLPLVGRLFRSEGESHRKRVLLIFAKVNVITPTGSSPNGNSQENISTQSFMP